jgi:putative flippase GtrA
MVRAAQHISRVPRLIRFGVVGGTCAILQLGSLFALVHLGMAHYVANIIAFLVVTQVNAILSHYITWHDRRHAHAVARVMIRRIVSFNVMALTTLVINEAVFVAILPYVNYLIAGAVGILAGAGINYMISSMIIFRHPRRLLPNQ